MLKAILLFSFAIFYICWMIYDIRCTIKEKKQVSKNQDD